MISLRSGRVLAMTGGLGVSERLGLERLESAEGLKPYWLDFGHKKRRPWTSFFDHLVGRGNLKPVDI